MATTKKKQQEATTPQVEARIDRLMDGDFKTKAFASATPTVTRGSRSPASHDIKERVVTAFSDSGRNCCIFCTTILRVIFCASRAARIRIFQLLTVYHLNYIVPLLVCKVKCTITRIFVYSPVKRT